MSKQKKKLRKQQNQMLAMNKRLTEDSFKLVLICCAFMLINTGVQMWYQAMEKDVADKQLEQAKKQYALDSLQYEQTARFMEEYKLLKEQRSLKAKQIRATERKIRNIETTKERIRKNLN